MDAFDGLNPEAAEWTPQNYYEEDYSEIPEDNYNPELEQFYQQQKLENLEKLGVLFPKVDPMLLYEIMENNYGDLNLSVAACLEHEEIEIVEVCKFFLLGDCRITNCAFQHSFKTPAACCRYWLRGNCHRGDECVYIHEIPEMPKPKLPQKRASEKRKYQPEYHGVPKTAPRVSPLTKKLKLDKLADMFPHAPPHKLEKCFTYFEFKMDPTIAALVRKYGPPSKAPPSRGHRPRNVFSSKVKGGWGSQVSAPPPPRPPAAPPNDMVKKLRTSSLQEQFPDAAPDIITDILVQCNYQLGPSRSQLSEIFGPPKNLQVKKVGSRVARKAQIGNKVREFKEGGFEWKSTGVGLNKFYSSVREEAAAHARNRNELFQRAVDAYRAGDKKGAKEFSRRGREEDEKMKKLHRHAAAKIFAQRNSQLTDRSVNPVLDLHGLHASEAIEILDEKLNIYYDNSQYVDIVIGTGHHSQSNWYRTSQEKLRPAVLGWLKEVEWCTFREFSGQGTKSKHGGYVRVTFLKGTQV